MSHNFAKTITKKIAGTAAGLSVLVLFGTVGSIETKTSDTKTAMIWSIVSLFVLAASVFALNRIGGDEE